MKQTSELRDLRASAVSSSCAPLLAALPRWDLRGLMEVRKMLTAADSAAKLDLLDRQRADE